MAKKAKKKVEQSPPPLTVLRVGTPEHLALGLSQAGEHTKVAVGLDLGTRCGFSYAVCRADGVWDFRPWQTGYFDLSSGRYESGNIGFLRLRMFLDVLKPVAIFYEDVKFTPGETLTKFSASRVMARCATSSELLSAFRQTMLLWAEDNRAYSMGYPIQTIKRWATGKGNANKRDMVHACNTRFGTDFGIEDCEQTGADDAADAVFVLSCGLEDYGKTLAGEDYGEQTASE